MTDATRTLPGGYRLERVLSRGASGEVWQASDARGDLRAARVFWSPWSDDRRVAERLAALGPRLVAVRHAHVVPVRDVITRPGSLAIVTDLVQGSDLRRVLAGEGPMPPADVAHFGAGIARGLQALHDAGLVHGDLTPGRVLIDYSRGAEPTPRLVGQGIVQVLSGSTLQPGSALALGSLEHAAPELASGRPHSVATDLYALGVVMYQMTTGVTPFAGPSLAAVLRAHAGAFPYRPDGVDMSLWDVIANLLRKDPAARPGSAAEVAEELAGLVPRLGGRPALPRVDAVPVDTATSHDGAGVSSRLASSGSTGSSRRADDESTGGGEGIGRRTVAFATVAALLVGIGGSLGWQRWQASRRHPVVVVTATATAVVTAPAPSTASSTAPTTTTLTAQQATAELEKLRAQTLSSTTIDGRIVVMLSSKYDGVIDPFQTSVRGGHEFLVPDIYAQNRALSEAMGQESPPVKVLTLKATDFGSKPVPPQTTWATIADPGVATLAEGNAWCAKLYPTLSGEVLKDNCYAITLSKRH